MPFLKTILVALATLTLTLPLTLQAAPQELPSQPTSGSGDGDVGYAHSPEPILIDPVTVALDKAPFCETRPIWSEVMAGISALDLRLAIEDGVLSQGDLPRAITALSEIGTADDLAALWNDADSLAWTYVSDVLDPSAVAGDVFTAQEAMHGSLRRTILTEWGARGDLPVVVLLSALDDPDPRVRRNATRLALASGEEVLEAAALTVCQTDPAVGEVSYICP